MKKYKIGIIGAAGFTGKELLKNLIPRKDITLEVINSQTFSGQKITEIFPELHRRSLSGVERGAQVADTNLKFTNLSPQEIHEKNLDVLFLALGSTESIKFLDKFTSERKYPHKSLPKIIDLSADFRFQNFETYQAVYGQENPHKNLKRVYGLPEISPKEEYANKLQKSEIIANPGCFAVTSILAAYPLNLLINKPLLDASALGGDLERSISHIILDGKTGVSGAGARPSDTNNFNNLSENCIPYKISHHRHTQEIQQFFPDIPISFTPHVIPVMRGMIVTAHIILKNPPSEEQIISHYKNFYKNHPNIIIQKKVPTMREVQHTNHCILGGFQIDHTGRLVIVAALDNLGKGASTGAIQNMDIFLNSKNL